MFSLADSNFNYLSFFMNTDPGPFLGCSGGCGRGGGGGGSGGGGCFVVVHIETWLLK